MYKYRYLLRLFLNEVVFLPEKAINVIFYDPLPFFFAQNCIYNIYTSFPNFFFAVFQIPAILSTLKELSRPALDWGPQKVPSTVHMEEMQNLKPSVENNSNIA